MHWAYQHTSTPKIIFLIGTSGCTDFVSWYHSADSTVINLDRVTLLDRWSDWILINESSKIYSMNELILVIYLLIDRILINYFSEICGMNKWIWTTF
jgi:hypothetical protein